VGETARRAKQSGLCDFAAVEAMAPSELEAKLYPSVVASTRPLPDCAWIHRERRGVGVTLQLLHLEYPERHADGYGYTQFCDHYREWLGDRGISMRQIHVAGEKTFVDYSGKTPCICDPKTGERIEVELFVAVPGASNLTYAEATRTQRGIASHTHAVEYFGVATEAFVCDQVRSGVTVP
jgi:transposase